MNDTNRSTTEVTPESIREALDRMREAEDARAGIRERFLTPTIGGARTVGVLATPLGEARSIGWVVCHAFGMEQVNLQSHEVPAARALAAAGFPVLRFHGQGYGDSDLPPAGVGLRSHLRDVLDAADLLIAETGVRRLGFLGVRLGGAAAALAAEQLGGADLVLWEPIVRGQPYVRSLLHLSMMLQLMHGEREDGSSKDLKQLMREQGFLDVQGFPLSAETFDELSSFDLVDGLHAYKGRSLVIQVSRSDSVRPELQRLVDALRQLGGDAGLITVTDEKANAFSEPRFKPAGDGTKVDTQAQLGDSLVSATVAWATANDEDGPPS